MTTTELAPDNAVDQVTKSLLEQLLAEPEQLILFDPDTSGYDALMTSLKDSVRANNIGKIVIEADKVHEYRYRAAMYGAGFHPTQFDEISYKETDLMGTELTLNEFGMWRVRQSPAVVARSNRMRDEIENNLFTSIVSTTAYDLVGVYITSEEDLLKIFAYDYQDLQACRALDFDLLYEREV